jgi:hypothetical protein
MIELLALPALDGRARGTLLQELSALAASHAGKTQFIVELARALFDLLGIKEAGALRERVVESYLPNLLGLQGGMPRRPAEAVFHDAPDRRTAAQTQIAAFSGPAAKKLSDWLRE